jgi:exonuclease III
MGEKSKKRNRTNGSARLKKLKNTRLDRWAKRGLNVGSMNIAGVSMFKLFMILETHTLDVLCLQETWLTTSNVQLNIPGY